MDSASSLHHYSARKFIEHCRVKFEWSDLTNDVIMDVGCGEYGLCGKSLLEKFPNVGSIVAIDCDPRVVRNFKLRNTKINVAIADIEERASIQSYEGRMTKVISTHTFHQLMQKEEAFRNVYRILKPGGEAAILFVMQSLIYEWLTEMLKIPKWKEIYQGHYVEDLYKSEIGTVQYLEMVEKMGFKVVSSFEEKRVIPYPTDQICKDSLNKMCGDAFKLSPEMLEEFKEESFEVLLKLSARDVEGRPCYRSTELSLLLIKPTTDSDSGTKKVES